jgi:hypothetical protein
VFTSIPGKRTNEPRFTLGLMFRHYSTRSPKGEFETQSGKFPFEHQGLQFAFLGAEYSDSDSSSWWNLSVREEGDATQPLEHGWRVTQRDPNRFSLRIAIDGQAMAAGGPVAKAFEAPQGWVLTFPLDEGVKAKVVVERNLPVVRWRLYREKAEQAYRWLRTKPAERGLPPTAL